VFQFITPDPWKWRDGRGREETGSALRKFAKAVTTLLGA